MASIENRSRFIVTVQNSEDLTQTFAYNREKQLKFYLAELKAGGYKPKLGRTNDSFAIRVREAGHRPLCLYALSEKEAIDIKQRLELERRNGLQWRSRVFSAILLFFEVILGQLKFVAALMRQLTSSSARLPMSSIVAKPSCRLAIKHELAQN